MESAEEVIAPVTDPRREERAVRTLERFQRRGVPHGKQFEAQLLGPFCHPTSVHEPVGLGNRFPGLGRRVTVE
ncbi:hypothetical protein GCM10011492_16320 [Flexivirga endophytica]|uniref:Uncharacterized protein n=1 Tax=Flexivirga endophytica TaxID=1849103 RepID=A0A916T309_9MICO|nr:hypothetical protein GCM10011492_16320 [Flexivirga endophytica]GHB55252.1 hypothetical protein GCM10008112_25630 [Flexivirga endophytica]